MKKRILSILLTLTFALSLVSAMGIIASAETEPNYLTFTAEEAGSWVSFCYLSGSI